MFCLYNPYIRDGGSVSTVETRIKEPTYLGDSLLKDFIFAFTIHILGIGEV